MVGKHAVYLYSREVGNVTVTEEGLYYCLSARCDLPVEKYRLRLSFQEKEMDLGLLVPNEKVLILNKRLPKKQLAGKDPQFFVQSTKATPCVILDPEQHFSELSRLAQAKLIFVDGKHALQFQG